MKRLFISVFIAIFGFSFVPDSFAQKIQDADTLIWSERRYAITVEPYAPSVLMVYYQINSLTSPFNFWSSNNNRGHVATFEILNEALYLRFIEAKRYRTRFGNLWTESGIDTVVSPDFFDITSKDSNGVFSPDVVMADWFTGFVKLALVPKDKKESKSDEADGNRYLFIRNGRIVENIFVSSSEQAKLAKDPSDSRYQIQRSMLERNESYIDFYARCSMDREKVIYDGHEGLFEHRPNSLTLAMTFYNNDVFAYFASCTDGRLSDAAPFGEWLLRGDSLFLKKVVSHRGKDVFTFATDVMDLDRFLSGKSVDMKVNNNGDVFADWITGDFVVHYGVWETTEMGVPEYTVSKTQKLRIVNGVVTSSIFSPSSFEDDTRAAEATAFSPCDQSLIYSVDDKQLAEAVGNYKHPKKNPSYWGDKPTFRSWFYNNSLTDERVKNRLFRVRLAFMVNCKGEVGQWKVISKGKGELYEFANIVLEFVKTMPQKWTPATDRKGNPVDCWQIMEFTVSDGNLTNGNYK